MCIRFLGGTSLCCELLLIIISCVGQVLMVNDSSLIAPFQNESTITASVSGNKEYVVYPATPEDISRLELDIERSFARDYVQIFRNAKNDVEFWVVQMNDIDHRNFLRNPSVRAQSDISADFSFK